MATSPEALLYKRVKENLPEAYITRIESRVNLGIPDCLIALSGMFVMVELKALKKGKKVRLSPHQIAFHLKHADIGAPTFILVEFRPPMPSEKIPELYLFSGAQAEEVARLGLDAEPLGRWPARAMQWHMLRHLLETA
jgi:penicillin-binding protein-related factor A (putative recombinase)